MISQKCTKCNYRILENSFSYARRTKDIFNILPYICKECLRIKKLFNPSQEEFKKTRKQYRLDRKNKILVKYLRSQLKNNIKTFKENQKFSEEMKRIENEEKKQRRKLNGLRILRSDTSKSEKKAIEQIYYNCPPGYHVDHIIPLSKGGTHCLENLRYMLASENVRKSNNIDINILKQYAQHETLSIPFLQRKFKMSYDNAKKVLSEVGIYQ